MRAGKHNLVIEQGAKFQWVHTLYDSNNALVNLTGMTGRMKIKNAKTGDLVISLTNQPSANVNGISLGGSAGTVTMTILSAQTTAMDFDEAVYDLEIVDTTGEPFRLLEGVVSFDRETTD